MVERRAHRCRGACSDQYWEWLARVDAQTAGGMVGERLLPLRRHCETYRTQRGFRAKQVLTAPLEFCLLDNT